MLFLPDHSSVVEFRHREDSISHCYFNLASALGLNYYYTLNDADSTDTVTENFTIDLVALEEVLSHFEG
ncbi:hypothetical protein [Algoriphagus namhaensis]